MAEIFKYMYIHLHLMATKSITITNDAYERLAVFKEPKESFSDVITKLTRKYSLLDLVGVLSAKETGEIKKHIRKSSKRMREQMNLRAARL